MNATHIGMFLYLLLDKCKRQRERVLGIVLQLCCICVLWEKLLEITIKDFAANKIQLQSSPEQHYRDRLLCVCVFIWTNCVGIFISSFPN